MSNLLGRLKKLEDHIDTAARCATCRDWPVVVGILEGEDLPAWPCPTCGYRPVPTIVFTLRPNYEDIPGGQNGR